MQKEDIFGRIKTFNEGIPEGEGKLHQDKQNELIDIINDVANYGKSIDIVDTDTNNKMNALFDIFINNSKRLSPDTISKIKQIQQEYNDYVVTEREKLPTDSFTIRPTLPPSSIVAPSLVPSKTIKNKRKRRHRRGGKTNKRKRESVGKSNKSKK